MGVRGSDIPLKVQGSSWGFWSGLAPSQLRVLPPPLFRAVPFPHQSVSSSKSKIHKLHTNTTTPPPVNINIIIVLYSNKSIREIYRGGGNKDLHGVAGFFVRWKRQNPSKTVLFVLRRREEVETPPHFSHFHPKFLGVKTPNLQGGSSPKRFSPQISWGKNAKFTGGV